MKEKDKNVWDKYWDDMNYSDLKEIIKGDPYYRLLKRFFKNFKNKKINIIEVGCGRGVCTLALIKEFPDYSFNAVFVDSSPIALSLARKNAEINGIKATFLLVDAFSLSFPNESFDIVWNEGVNEHFDNDKRQLIFNEMFRICKKGGEIIVMVPNALNLPYRAAKKFLESSGRWVFGFEKPYTIFELKERIKNSGATVVKSGGVQIIASLFSFLGPILGIKNKQATLVKDKDSNIKKIIKILKRADFCIEGIFGEFLGQDIGVVGIKK